MPCRHVALPNGTGAIVCGPRERRRKCSNCGRPADLLCDWRLSPDDRPSRKSRTCDAPLCETCSTKPMPDKDLCPAHAAAFEDWKARRAK